MERDMNYYYLDAIITNDMTVAELDEEIKRLKEESDKLTDWKPM